MILTLEQLQEKCREWQEILRMQDWDFLLKIKRSFDMPVQDACGACNTLLAKRSVVIKIMDPNDFDPDIVEPFDMEETLIHEMLHALVWQFESEESNKRGSLEWAAKEQTIDFIAKALVKLKRGV